MNSSSNKKIPYDASPIARDSSASRQSPARKNFSNFIFVAAIFLFNIVISSLFIYYVYNNKNTNSITINNQIVAEGTVSAVAASKAKLSSVCIGAGGEDENGVLFGKKIPEESYDPDAGKINIPNYAELLTRTALKGSGVIIDIDKSSGEAYILTCNHVIGNYSAAVFVLLYDSYFPVQATVVGRSTNYDLAVLKVEDDQVKGASQAATVANSSFVVEGEDAIAVGNPQSNGFAVTVGHVSRTNILASANGLSIRSLQVDTPINAGNSGGGLYDKNGNLIGIVRTKNTSDGIDNVATAIHSNTALSIANNLMEGRQLQYVDLGVVLEIKGVEIQQIDGKIYRTDKVFVKSVSETSDAYNKLKAGQQIIGLSYNGKTVQVLNEYCFEEIKFDLRIGDTIEFSILGRNEPISVQITKLVSDY